MYRATFSRAEPSIVQVSSSSKRYRVFSVSAYEVGMRMPVYSAIYSPLFISRAAKNPCPSPGRDLRTMNDALTDMRGGVYHGHVHTPRSPPRLRKIREPREIAAKNYRDDRGRREDILLCYHVAKSADRLRKYRECDALHDHEPSEKAHEYLGERAPHVVE